MDPVPKGLEFGSAENGRSIECGMIMIYVGKLGRFDAKSSEI